MNCYYRLFVGTLLSLFVASASAGMPFDMAATMSTGGWQEREEITSNQKGKVTASHNVWMGVVGREVRNAVPHLWLEVRMQPFKVNRKGERSPKGEFVIMKTLVEESALNDFTNPMTNMRKFAKEIIVKSGKAQPMRIRMEEGGMMSGMLMKSFGANIDFKINDTGVSETVSVAAGEIDAIKISGTGSVEMKVLIRTIKVESEMESWMSSDIPLGVVKQHIRNITNGKTSTVDSQLLSYGTTGATSMIVDSDIQEMPTFKMPSFGAGNKNTN